MDSHLIFGIFKFDTYCAIIRDSHAMHIVQSIRNKVERCCRTFIMNSNSFAITSILSRKHIRGNSTTII